MDKRDFFVWGSVSFCVGCGIGTLFSRPGFVFLGLIVLAAALAIILKPGKKIIASFLLIIALGCFYPFIHNLTVDSSKQNNTQDYAIMRPLFYAKGKLSENIKRILSPSSSSLALGIIFGDKSGFSSEFRDNLKLSGTSHITALSGFNITIIVSFIGALLFFIPIKLRPLASLAGIVAFVGMVGPSASVVRAAIMGGLIILARNAGRVVDIKGPMALAALLMVFRDPSIITNDAGFILSFSALLGVAFIAPRLKEKFFKENKTGIIKNVFIESISAEITIAPAVMLLFGSFNWLSFIPNIMIIWSVPLAMAFSFLSGTAAIFSDWIAFPFSVVAEALLSYEINVINISARCFQYLGF